MNLFVIMPFAPDFEDVYVTIKTAVKERLAGDDLQCFRLDEIRAAGRITPRLIEELGAASLCVADLTGLRPNVMWEVGYAMALGKPTIIITQDRDDLPFDIRDMHTVRYDRGHLNQTLGQALARCVIDTVTAVRHANPHPTEPAPEREALVAGLLIEVRGLKDMLGQAVKAWNPVCAPAPLAAAPGAVAALVALEGSWHSPESGSHFYARVMDRELVVPYCFQGNDKLTGVYFGWRQIGEYWFGRFRWLNGAFAGFAFLQQKSPDTLAGAWWVDGGSVVPELPHMGSGVPAVWERKRAFPVPSWAELLFEEALEEGLESRLARGFGRRHD